MNDSEIEEIKIKIETLEDMYKVNPKDLYLQKIQEYKNLAGITDDKKLNLAWNESHDRCQSSIIRVNDMIHNHPNKKSANYRQLKSILDVMKELLQSSPDDMEERIKCLMVDAWNNYR